MKKKTTRIRIMTMLIIMTMLTSKITFAANDHETMKGSQQSQAEVSGVLKPMSGNRFTINEITADAFNVSTDEQIEFNMEIENLDSQVWYGARVEVRVLYENETFFDHIDLFGTKEGFSGSFIVTDGKFPGEYFIDNVTLYEMTHDLYNFEHSVELWRIYSDSFYDSSIYNTMPFPDQLLHVYGTQGNVKPVIKLTTDKPEYSYGDQIRLSMETSHPVHDYNTAIINLNHIDYKNNVTLGDRIWIQGNGNGTFSYDLAVDARTTSGRYEISHIELLSESSGELVILNQKYKAYHNDFYSYLLDFDFSYSVTGTSPDTSRPVFHGVTLPTSTVDKNDPISIEVQAEDMGSGTKSGYVHIFSYKDGINDNQYLPLKRLNDTTMITEAKLDPFTTLLGTYSVIGVRIFDEAGNWMQEYFEQSPEKFENLDFNVEGMEHLGEISGSNRYNTAIEISREIKPGKTVIVALGENYPDALSAGPLAFKLNAPIILAGNNRISSNALARISELAPEKIIVLGGTSAISDKVLNDIKGLGNHEVIRVSGKNRYATAAEVADLVVEDGISSNAILANGQSFADALSIGGYAAQNSTPILLTATTTLSKDTRAYLIDKKVKHITIIGGYSAISQQVEKELSELGISVNRVQGDNRYETSVNIAKHFYSDPEFAIVSSGLSFADALAAAPLAAELNIPILLTRDTKLMDITSSYLVSEGAKNLRTVTVVGGNAAVNETVKKTINELLCQ